MSKIEDEAIAWHLKVREPSFAEWDAFTDWLERDPAHSTVYDSVALADEEFGALSDAAGTRRDPLEQPERSPRPQARLFRFGGWAVAASLLAVTSTVYLTQQSSTYVIETAAGEHRTITLPDGSQIALNGDTAITLDRDRPRFAELESGEALFTVVHRESDPFTVLAQGRTLVDLGTIFNVSASGEALEVAVAEGAVMFEPDGQAVKIDPGQKLRASGAANAAVTKVDVASIADWSEGQLVYDNALLGEVAADLSRSLGVDVRVDAAAAGQRFSGVIQVDGEASALLPTLAPLLNVDVRNEGGEWRLQSKGRSGG